jgi:ABC-type Na+ efflux pump permease subunit
VRPSEPRLPEPWTALLLAVFGAATCASILAFGGSGAGSLDLLALGASLGAIAVAGVWLFLIATAQSRAWAVAFAATFWIPYVNLVVASVFARRYWERGARAPALLGAAALFAQSLAALRVLLPDLTPPV